MHKLDGVVRSRDVLDDVLGALVVPLADGELDRPGEGARLAPEKGSNRRDSERGVFSTRPQSPEIAGASIADSVEKRLFTRALVVTLSYTRRLRLWTIGRAATTRIGHCQRVRNRVCANGYHTDSTD